MVTEPGSWIIVSDFDGTISQEDLVVSLTTHFSDQNVALVEAMQAGKISLRQGLQKVFANLKSADRERYLAYAVTHGALRPGFEPAVQAFAQWHLPFFVVSNGLDFMVKPLLHGWVSPSHLYCNRANFQEPTIAIEWPWPCLADCGGGCGLCKPRIVQWLRLRYQAQVAFIGDGRTDFLGAEAADLVFARAALARHFDQHHWSYLPFETFDDVVRGIRTRLLSPCLRCAEPSLGNSSRRQTSFSDTRSSDPQSTAPENRLANPRRVR